MNITVRKATTNDIDEIEQLYNDLNDYLKNHENYPRWKKGVYPSRKHAEDAFAEGVLYVAEIDAKVVGGVIYSAEQDEAYQKVNWQIAFDVPIISICKLAVHPEYLKCGVGKALVEYASVVGKQQQVKAIRLDTYEKNLPAIRLYEKCGFVDMGLVDLGLEKIYGLKWYKVFEKLL